MNPKQRKIYKTCNLEGKINLGVFHGYAATWDRDPAGDMFKRGAFAKSIMERAKGIPVMIRHFRDGADIMEQVGELTGAHEDEIGLAVSGRYFDDELSQHARGKVLQGVEGMSVGFYALQETVPQMGQRDVSEAKLVEVTITNQPQNPNAKILDAKSVSTEEPSPPTKAVDTRMQKWMLLQSMSLSLLEVNSRA